MALPSPVVDPPPTETRASAPRALAASHGPLRHPDWRMHVGLRRKCRRRTLRGLDDPIGEIAASRRGQHERPRPIEPDDLVGHLGEAPAPNTMRDLPTCRSNVRTIGSILLALRPL